MFGNRSLESQEAPVNRKVHRFQFVSSKVGSIDHDMASP